MRVFDHLSGHYLTVDGAEIYYEETGEPDGPALLLLHGGFGNLEDFNGILPELAATHRVIGIDSRGHGKSTRGDLPLTYERIQHDVERVLEHLAVETVRIIGFSDGGIVAYRLAARDTFPVEKLVTIGADWHIKDVEGNRMLFHGLTGGMMKKLLPRAYDAYQQWNPEPDFDRLTRNLVALWLDGSAAGYPNESVKNITCPLLIVRGERDHLCSEKGAEELAALVPNARLLNIPSAGHTAFDDQKDVFLANVNSFLMP